MAWKRVTKMGWEIRWQDGWRATVWCFERSGGWEWNIYQPGNDNDMEPHDSGPSNSLGMAKSDASRYHKAAIKEVA